MTDKLGTSRVDNTQVEREKAEEGSPATIVLGLRTVKDAPKRVQGARDLAREMRVRKKLGAEIKQVYLTFGPRRST
jgi:hypothetical protein